MKIEVWMEGYMATGEHGPAYKLGEYEADNFDQAIEKLLDSDPENKQYYRQTDGRHYIWSCRLYDNEQDARKSFG